MGEEDRKIYGEGPISEDSYASWYMDAVIAQDPEVQRLQAQLDQQAEEIVRTIEERG